MIMTEGVGKGTVSKRMSSLEICPVKWVGLYKEDKYIRSDGQLTL